MTLHIHDVASISPHRTFAASLSTMSIRSVPHVGKHIRGNAPGKASGATHLGRH